MDAEISLELESTLLDQAAAGDSAALENLIQPLRRPLFSYIYRMVSGRQDAEDLLQDVLVRVLQNLPSFRRESGFKTWLFGIATHVCLDHLKYRKRWSVEAQLIGEEQADKDTVTRERLYSIFAKPDFTYDLREHIAFCFSCVSRTLPPEEQAALMLKEVLGFTAQEAARMLEVSEPVFRHRLQASRDAMTGNYEGLCQLINKTGLCWQCKGLREVIPEAKRGPDLVQIEVGPGRAITPEALFDARIEIVKEADYAEGRSTALHDFFLENLSNREENRT